MNTFARREVVRISERPLPVLRIGDSYLDRAALKRNQQVDFYETIRIRRNKIMTEKRRISMKGKMCLRAGMVILMVAALVGLVIPAVAQDKAADNMQILREKIKADKKLVVAGNMELTESEAKGFWPVYEEYQKELTGDQPAHR